MEVGQDGYAVFVGGGGLSGDLYAVRPDGGAAIPITFTNVAELAPALSPDGIQLAFLRAQSLSDSTPATAWVMSLLTGSDRELKLPKGAGPPRRVGWDRDGRSLLVEAKGGLYRINAPPGSAEVRPVPPADRGPAESSLAVLLGNPVFARVVPCETAGDLCVATDSGASGLLARGAHDALRWGADSVAFFVGDELEIRPLARGRPRLLGWSNVPKRPRQMTFFPGGRSEK